MTKPIVLTLFFCACPTAKPPLVLGGSSDEAADTGASEVDSGTTDSDTNVDAIVDTADSGVELEETGVVDTGTSEVAEEECDPATYVQSCFGEDVVNWCEDGFEQSYDCAETGLTCDDSGPDGYAECVPVTVEDDVEDTGSADTGSIEDDTGGDSGEAFDTADSDTGDSGFADTGGDTSFEDTAALDTAVVIDTADSGEVLEETGSASFPCTDCVEVVYTPSAATTPDNTHYGVGSTCATMESSWVAVTPTADGGSWVFDVPVIDGYLVRYSVDFGDDTFSCNVNDLDGTVTATYYKADGVTSCEVTVDELLKSSGGCEAQLVASCPDTAPTCPAF